MYYQLVGPPGDTNVFKILDVWESLHCSVVEMYEEMV